MESGKLLLFQLLAFLFLDISGFGESFAVFASKSAAEVLRLRFRLFEFDSVRVLYVVIFVYPYHLDAADGLYQRKSVLV